MKVEDWALRVEFLDRPGSDGPRVRLSLPDDSGIDITSALTGYDLSCDRNDGYPLARLTLQMNVLVKGGR